MSSNGHKLELPASIVIRDLALKIEKSPIELIKKLMSNGVMATINQTVDFDTAAIVVGEYGFEAVLESTEEEKVETGSAAWRRDRGENSALLKPACGNSGTRRSRQGQPLMRSVKRKLRRGSRRYYAAHWRVSS
jgi:hypothetical protein